MPSRNRDNELVLLPISTAEPTDLSKFRPEKFYVRGYFGVEIEPLSNDFFILFQLVKMKTQAGRRWILLDNSAVRTSMTFG